MNWVNLPFDFYFQINGVRWHQCTYCSKEFKKPSDLVRHIRIHTHEKPYKCSQCYRAFAVKSTLTAHVKTHTGVKEYKCHVCDKMFSTQGSLKVHLRLHTGKKGLMSTLGSPLRVASRCIYDCIQVRRGLTSASGYFMFSTQGSPKVHLRLHTGKKGVNVCIRFRDVYRYLVPAPKRIPFNKIPVNTRFASPLAVCSPNQDTFGSNSTQVMCVKFSQGNLKVHQTLNTNWLNTLIPHIYHFWNYGWTFYNRGIWISILWSS